MINLSQALPSPPPREVENDPWHLPASVCLLTFSNDQLCVLFAVSLYNLTCKICLSRHSRMRTIQLIIAYHRDEKPQVPRRQVLSHIAPDRNIGQIVKSIPRQIEILEQSIASHLQRPRRQLFHGVLHTCICLIDDAFINSY